MRTPISYYGGKQNLVDEILPLIPKHIQYVEPFIGGAAVFFKKRPSKNEVINDLDGRVTNFYRVAQTKFFELQSMIQGTAHSEIEYYRSMEILKADKKDDVEWAWAFWAQCQLCFGHALFHGYRFSNNGEAKNTANKRDAFTEKYMHRLRNVEIFNRDAIDIIKLKDSPDTFFYCDPPYVSSAQGHYKGYTEENFIELLTVLSKIEGKFLLSSYPEKSLMDFRSIYEWKNDDKIKALNFDTTEDKEDFKTECLTYNYEIKKDQLAFTF